MKRLVLAAVVAASMLGGVHEWVARGAVSHTANCTNSFPSDGHSGPWRTTNGGGTLHGNTVKATCPNGSTHWHNSYCLQEQDPSSGVWVNVQSGACPDQQGNGTGAAYSISINPFGCSPNLFRTRVNNLVTGGIALKPSGGAGVHITCG